MSGSRLAAATRLLASSGRLVPKATAVRPMTRSATPRSLATETAPRISSSAPITRSATPTTTAARLKPRPSGGDGLPSSPPPKAHDASRSLRQR